MGINSGMNMGIKLSVDTHQSNSGLHLIPIKPSYTKLKLGKQIDSRPGQLL